MTDQQLIDLATKEPATADAVTSALRRVVDFQKTRGELLRSIAPVPHERQEQ